MSAAAAPVQQAFDLRLPAGRPLVPIEAVMVLIDRDEDDILNLIETKILLPAFDIASTGAERREIRIHRAAILNYMKSDYATLLKTEKSIEEIIRALLPKPTILKIGRHSHETIRGTELQRRFSCSQWLVGNLGLLKEIDLCPIQIGPKTSPYYQHESVIDFLVRRELGKGKAAA